MGKIQLTTAEMEILSIIATVMEYNEKNPGNIPTGGIDEIIVSNGLMESEVYERGADSLFHYGLIDSEDFLTEAGKNYINQFANDAEKLKKDKNAVCENDYSKVDFAKVKEWIKKIPWDQLIDNGCRILTAGNTVLNMINALK